jgi:hypothetical protein
MGVSCFHWLDNSASGSVQADYCWRTLGPIISAVGPVALQVDCEDSSRPATYAILRDFIAATADRMGHLPYVYTGDWWATASGRAAWDVRSLTPWLMAAPNSGYPGSYPGDQSGQWRAGYWGYGDLSLMQYAVSPIAGAGGSNISKTAIRDPQIWAALTGGTDVDVNEHGWVNNADKYLWALTSMMDTVPNILVDGKAGSAPNALIGFLKALDAKVSALQSGQVPPATLAIALQDPAVLAAIAKAVNDDAARRQVE